MLLAVDPALVKSGYALINKNKRIVEYGTIRTSKEDKTRLKTIFDEVSRLILIYKPEKAFVEQCYVNINRATSMLLTQAIAAVILAFQTNFIPYETVVPCHLKKVMVAHGHANKQQVMDFIKQNFSYKKLKEDEADAILLALYAFQKTYA